ncbi:MAG TPA: ATP-binding cassette domain-containing protein [Phycisphaerae bacterium]|nr:ATP-binding cassette domain-containing protein [Phycisphaerae bacterium]
MPADRCDVGGVFVPLLEVLELTKEFPTPIGPPKRAVDHLSFHVNAGEIYGLLGPNGAGKTTTLRIVSGLMRPTAGRAIVNGVDVTIDPSSVRGFIGFLTAGTGLYHRLTAREILVYFAELNGLERGLITRRVDQLIDWLGMADFAELRCGALSTGQKQRTNIARALIADPPVLVMDEPTLGLDVLTNRLILDFIRHERELGKAILLSTHHLDEAEALCDRIGLLHEGRLIAEGNLQTLREMAGCRRLTDVFLRLVGQAMAPTLPFKPPGEEVVA